MRLVDSAPLPYLLSIPNGDPAARGLWPLLLFLHGYDEGVPAPIEEALTRHGPLAATASPLARSEFIVVAPQMPTRGDVWHRFSADVQTLVREIQTYGADPHRMFLTGFSFGGNGVFDLALAQRDVWAALWPVDPTRVPREDPGRPVWLSSGAVSRRYEGAFIHRLDLSRPGATEPGDRVHVDEGEDHVGTARLAYQDDRIYRWLLSRAR